MIESTSQNRTSYATIVLNQTIPQGTVKQVTAESVKKDTIRYYTYIQIQTHKKIKILTTRQKELQPNRRWPTLASQPRPQTQ
jgi:hypothetical protein